MDYLEPASPESTDSDSVAEEGHTTHAATSGIFHFASHITSSLSGTPSKRRLPGSSSGAASHTRDAKSRRKEFEGPRRNSAAGSNGGWIEGMEKRDKDDLVDVALAEHLKKGAAPIFSEAMVC